MQPRPGRNASPSQILIQAAAFALLFGLLEGAVIFIFRYVPTVLAQEKVSADILYAAPFVHLPINLVLAVLLILAARWLPMVTPALTAAVFTFPGVIALLHYPKRLSPWAVVFLALGICVQTFRWLRPREERFVSLTRRSLLPLTACVVVLAIGLPIWRNVSEFVEKRNLPPAPQDAPSVLFIVLDAVRADRMSCYGYARPTTPFLNEWVQKAVLFENAYSPSSWSLPSHSTLLTGRYLHEDAPDWSAPVVPEEHPQLQEALLARGYLTASFSANRFFVVPELGYGRGYLHVDPYPFRMLLSRTTYGRVLRVKLIDYNIRMAPELTAGTVVDHFLAWHDKQANKPFFVFLNFMDAHEPYMPPAPYDRYFSNQPADLKIWRRGSQLSPEKMKILSDAYDGGLAYMDSQLKKLFAALAQRGRMDNTLVVILSDHGESLGRDGIFDHGRHLYREQIHIPLIFRLPGKVPEGVRVAAAVSGADLPATIAQLTGLSSSQPFPGNSLARFWNPAADNSANINEMAISELTTKHGAALLTSALTTDWQYIVDLSTAEEWLFDLRSDPALTRNLAKDPQSAPVLLQFRSRLDERYQSFPEWQPGAAVSKKRVKTAP